MDGMLTTKEAIESIAELSEKGSVFGIRTEIGTLVVQTTYTGLQFPVLTEVYKWDDAPKNDYIREANKSGKRYDFYVILGIYRKSSELYRYIFAAEIMAKLWTMKTGGDINDRALIDSRIYLFLTKHLKRNYTQYDLVEEMKKLLWKKKRVDVNTESLLNYYITNRIEKAKSKI